MVLRPFVHWCVVATLSFRTCPIRLTTRSGSLNDMMTIPDADEESSGDEADDGDAGEDEEE